MTVEAPTAVRSVYVHAPFCARRCFYCDFAVQVRRNGGATEWLGALGAELDILASEGLFTLDSTLDTLYVGGGTPSLLGREAMGGLVELFGRSRLEGPTLEWTAEANPESLTQDVARSWVSAGVNRVSLGAQSFHEPTLRWMGRLHGSDGPGEAVHVARMAGLQDLSIDLMFGLPEHLGRPWRRDLESVLELDVPHVSLYGLTVEAATPLGRAVGEGRERPADEGRYREEFLLAAEVLAAAGYEHYEVSNFARPGHASRHNTVYWTGLPYLGLGNGAHSYAHPTRRWNVRGWDDYRSAVRDGASPEEGRERLGQEEVRLESIWLGLRTRHGIGEAALGSPARQIVMRWEQEGLATCRGGRIRLTTEGWLVMDRLAVELDATDSA
jgi:oxygen-independent coproporphyrinogen-3 oxidase